MLRQGLGGALAGMAAMLPGPALAAAWVADGAQSIATVAYGQEDDREYSQSDLYLELPVKQRWAIVAHPRYETGVDNADGWRADAELGAKASLLSGVHGPAAALQAAALWRSDPDPGCHENGGEVRALGGVSHSVGRGSVFLNAEGALRMFGSNCLRQRFELTAGYRPSERWLTMGQAFLDADRKGEAIVRAQTSVVRFFGGHGVQLGVRVRLDGEEREPSLVLGWWETARP